MATLLQYGKEQAEASASGMKYSVVAFALYSANGHLPKDDPRKINLTKARKEVQETLKAMNENTAKTISAMFPRLASKLIERHGEPGATAKGERAFWDVLNLEAEEAVALAIADIRSNGWGGTWTDLRRYVGIKPPAPPKTPADRLAAAVEAAIKHLDSGELTASDIKTAITELNGAVTVTSTTTGHEAAELVQAA